MDQAVLFNGSRDISYHETDMPRFGDILLEIWAEACQHIEIQQSASGITAKLQSHMPLESLHVIRLEPDHHWLAVVAIAPSRGAEQVVQPGEPSEARYRQLVNWVRKGSPIAPVAEETPLPVTMLGLDSLTKD